jgi:hypothetical protein
MINLREKMIKKKLLKSMTIKPVYHQKISNGQTKYRVGKAELTNHYYCLLG